MSEMITKIVMPENFPGTNKGEHAIIIGMIETFKSIGSTEITFFSKWLRDDLIRYSDCPVKVLPLKELKTVNSNNRLLRMVGKICTLIQYVFCAIAYKFNLRLVLKLFQNSNWTALMNADLIIMGHDNTIFSGMSVRYFAIYLFGRISGKLVVIYETSVGVIKQRYIRLITKHILRRVDLITARDPISFNYIKDLKGNEKKLFLTTDTAFLMNAALKNEVHTILLKENVDLNKPVIGMTVTRFIGNYTSLNAKEKEEAYTKHVKIFSQVIDSLIEELHVTILMIPHVIGPTADRDDRIMAKDVVDRVENRSSIVNIEEEYSAEALKGIIGQCELFVGARTHSIIASTAIYVPMVALSSSNKKLTAS